MGSSICTVEANKVFICCRWNDFKLPGVIWYRLSVSNSTVSMHEFAESRWGEIARNNPSQNGPYLTYFSFLHFLFWPQNWALVILVLQCLSLNVFRYVGIYLTSHVHQCVFLLIQSLIHPISQLTYAKAVTLC